MTRPNRRHVLLAGVLLALLGLGGSASAASGGPSRFPYTTTTLTHVGVEHLVAHGERLRLTSKTAEKTEVRLFVYARALTRGGQRPVLPPDEKVYISPNVHVIFPHPGQQWVTLHVNRVDRAALLRAGTITEGYFYAGYKVIQRR